MAIREKKPTDHNEIFKCCDLIMQTIRENSEIDGTLWSSAMARLIAEVYAGSCTHEEYCQEMKKVAEYYKCLWENKKND